jgi:hypothetical protein
LFYIRHEAIVAERMIAEVKGQISEVKNPSAKPDWEVFTSAI